MLRDHKMTNSRKVNQARQSHKRSLKAAFKAHKGQKRGPQSHNLPDRGIQMLVDSMKTNAPRNVEGT
jgi:hypothetical protein